MLELFFATSKLILLKKFDLSKFELNFFSIKLNRSLVSSKYIVLRYNKLSIEGTPATDAGLEINLVDIAPSSFRVNILESLPEK